ncbi:MAG: ABC transporter permease [Bacteroidota bacterium]
MLGTIIKKEILENILSFRFVLFLLICAILIPLAMYVNDVGYQKNLRDYDEQLRLANQDASTLQMGDLMGGRVHLKGFRHPSALSVIAQGLENILPRYYEFNQDGYKQGDASVAEQSTLSAQGKLDFSFIIQIIISLIVMLFASDVISGEKELGTLRVTLSNSLPRDILLLGKLIGGYLSVWIPFTIAFIVGALMLVIRSFPVFAPEIGMKFVLIFFLSSIFIFAYFVIGMMVSASSIRSRTALVAILLGWAFLQLIVPKASDMIASAIYPVRTETAISLQTSLLTNSLETEKAKEKGREYVAIMGGMEAMNNQQQDSPQQARWNEVEKQIDQKYADEKARRMAEITEGHAREKKVQESIALGLSLISPSAAFYHIITDMCGTGELAKSKYIDAVKQHQNSLESAVFSSVKRTMMTTPDGKTMMRFSAQPVDFKTLPNFSIPGITAGEIFKDNLANMLSIVFWMIVPFGIAYVRFLKYDVR